MFRQYDIISDPTSLRPPHRSQEAAMRRSGAASGFGRGGSDRWGAEGGGLNQVVGRPTQAGYWAAFPRLSHQ